MASGTITRTLRQRLLTYRNAAAVIYCTGPNYNIKFVRNVHKCASSLSEAVPDTLKPAENQRESSNLDPFGIEDVADNSSILVQGYFEQDWSGVKKKEQLSEEPREDTPKVSLPNKKKYDEWLQHRETVRVREKSGKDAEARRYTNFGNVRLDSDNAAEEELYEMPAPRLKPKPVAVKPEENPPSRATRILASEYLKKFKKEVSAEALKKQGQSKQTQDVVEEPTTPRLVKRKTQNDFDQEQYIKILGPNVVDQKKVPDIYKLPEYNKFAQTDMWSLLKHTVIFQNDYIFAINKPSGVPIHSPAIDCRHYITQFLPKFAELAQVEHIYALHRLDKETSGVLLFAKDARMAKYMTEKFAGRQIEKKYLAITKGCPRLGEGTIKIPIGYGHAGGSEKYRSVLKPDLREYEIFARHKNCRDAITHFNVLSSREDTAFLEIQMETGVKHQIRVHLGLGLGCPIIGDHKYSHRDKMAPQRLHPHLLHAIKVKQSKVRELPLHLHCSSVSFNLPEGATDSKEPVYIHANVPRFFKHTLRAFGLKH